jgi:hypothetical protein
MRKTITALVLAVTTAALPVASLPAHAARPATVRPCATEDSPGPCHWNAQTRGNGRGRSFTRAADGTITYTLPASLPSWAHWKTAPRGACRHGATGIIAWGGHGDGVVICSSGEIEAP